MDRMNISLREALALSVAIHEKYGYQSKRNLDFTSVTPNKQSNLDGKGNPIPNSARLYRQLFPSDKVAPENREQIDVLPEHYCHAQEIIETLRGFSFIAVQRPLTKFETSILEIIRRDTITHKELGRVSSFPNVYERKISQEAWEDRESELAQTSKWLGVPGTYDEFELVVENIRYLSRTESYLVCASESGSNIIKFFVSENKLSDIVEGDKINVSCWVKKQEFSRYHGGEETMVNRVKFLDRDILR